MAFLLLVLFAAMVRLGAGMTLGAGTTLDDPAGTAATDSSVLSAGRVGWGRQTPIALALLAAIAIGFGFGPLTQLLAAAAATLAIS